MNETSQDRVDGDLSQSVRIFSTFAVIAMNTNVSNTAPEMNPSEPSGRKMSLLQLPAKCGSSSKLKGVTIDNSVDDHVITNPIFSRFDPSEYTANNRKRNMAEVVMDDKTMNHAPTVAMC